MSKDITLNKLIKDGKWSLPENRSAKNLFDFMKLNLPKIQGGEDIFLVDDLDMISVKEAWCIYFGKENTEVEWSMWLWKCSAPKLQLFHLWKCFLSKVATLDNLKRRGFHLASRCVLYEDHEEDLFHLFFNCSFALNIWNLMVDKKDIPVCPKSLYDLCKWSSKKVKTYAVCLVYQIWFERNNRIFVGRSLSHEKVEQKVQAMAAVLFYP